MMRISVNNLLPNLAAGAALALTTPLLAQSGSVTPPPPTVGVQEPVVTVQNHSPEPVDIFHWDLSAGGYAEESYTLNAGFEIDLQGPEGDVMVISREGRILEQYTMSDLALQTWAFGKNPLPGGEETAPPPQRQPGPGEPRPGPDTSQPDQQAESAPPPRALHPMIVNGQPAPMDITQLESLTDGRVRLFMGQSEEDVLDQFRRQPVRGRVFYQGATGDYVQEWDFPEHDVLLIMMTWDRGAPMAVEGLDAGPGSAMRTVRGVGIGSTEQELLDAYPEFNREQTIPGEEVVVGSVYGGLIFSLDRGRVSRIFVGAAAE